MNDIRLNRRSWASRLRLQGQGELTKIIGNLAWLSFDRALRIAATALVMVAITRYLGPEQFGIYSYALAFIALFATLATLGLNTIVVREIVRDPSRTDAILGTTFLLRLGAGLIATALAIGAISLSRPGDDRLRLFVSITAAGLLFKAFDTVDLYFQARVESRYAVYARNGAVFIVTVVQLALVAMHAPLITFAWASIADAALVAVGMGLVYRARGRRLTTWNIDRVQAGRLMRDAWPLMLSGLAVSIYMYIDQVMLGQMVGLEAVGIYSAATRISELWYFVPMAIASSTLPALINAKITGEQLYYARLRRLFVVMVALAYAVAVPVTFLSGRLVAVLFGVGYAAAAPILAVHVWAGVFVVLGLARELWIAAENLTRYSLATATLGAVANIILNLFLLPAYGPLGAAIATLVSYALATVIGSLLFKETRRVGRMMLAALILRQ